MAEGSWWETFFTGLFVEAQRRLSANERQTEAEANFLHEAFGPGLHAKVLDVPCGNGRLALALARRGFRVTGVDISGELIGDARQAAAGLNVDATFEHRDMRGLTWQDEFDHAFCCGNSFAYFGDADNREFLRSVGRAVKRGGVFVLQTALAAESILPQTPQRQWYPFGDLYFLHETEYEPAAGRLTSHYTLIRNGRIERNAAVYQVYMYRELLAMFRDAGFADVAGYCSLDKQPYRLGAANLWLVARKG